MKSSISFLTRLEKRLKVTALKAKLNENTPNLTLSIEVTPSAFFLIEKYSWFNLHPQSRGEGHQHLNRHRAVILDLSLSKEVIELVKEELNTEFNLLQYIQEQAENSPLLQTENWMIWQIRQILPTINAKGKTVEIENKYPTLWAENEPNLPHTQLSEQVENLLNTLQWEYKTEVEKNEYRMDYYGDKGAWQCRISVDNLKSICQFVSMLPTKVPKERHLHIIQYLTKLNQTATIAHFSFHTKSDRVVCKSAKQIGQGEILSKKQFVELAEANTQTMDQYIEKLLKICDMEVPKGFKGFRRKVTF